MVGGQGDDRLFGDSGHDRLEGNDGNDFLDGGSDNDLLIGGEGAGDDILTGGAGEFDRLFGGAGNDRYVITDNWYADVIMESGGGDADLLDLSGVTSNLHASITPSGITIQAGANILFSTLSSIEKIWAGDGDDAFTLSASLPGIASSLDGGGGDNTLNYRGFAAGVKVNLSDVISTGAGIAAHSASGVANVVNITNVIGTSGNDILIGDDYPNQLDGLAGDDILWGGRGNDILLGGPGQDDLFGEDGDDRYVIDPGYTRVTMHEDEGHARNQLATFGGSDTIDVSAFQTAVALDLTLNDQNLVGNNQVQFRFEDGSSLEPPPSGRNAAENFENVIGSLVVSNRLSWEQLTLFWRSPAGSTVRRSRITSGVGTGLQYKLSTTGSMPTVLDDGQVDTVIASVNDWAVDSGNTVQVVADARVAIPLDQR